MSRHQFVSSLLVATLCSAIQGEDLVFPVQPVAPAPPAAVGVASLWTFSGRVGAYISNVTTANADTSRDATIKGSSTTASYLFSYEGEADWKEGANSVGNLLKAKYGRQKQQGQDWIKNNDEIRYDGVYRREISKPNFIYLAWGAESVFQGPPPKGNAFDPTTGKISGGVGQLYENFLPDTNKFEWRLGSRVQKRWGDSVPDNADGIETGLEAFARYEQKLKRESEFSFFTQYEGFSEFNDIAHVTNLVTAGLVIQLTKYLSAEFDLRAYYETRPKEDRSAHALAGFNQWSVRQDSLLGLNYIY